MSWQTVRAVFESSQSKGAARLVLLAIADRADESGRGAFLSSAQLQAAANVDDRTVRRALRELEGLGELAIVGRARNGANTFAVVLAGATPGVLPGGHIARGSDVRGGRAARPGGPGISPPATKRSENDPKRDQDPRPPAAPVDPVEKARPLRALARAILLEDPKHYLGPGGLTEWTEEIKTRAARMKLPYCGESVRIAQDGAERQAIRERRAS